MSVEFSSLEYGEGGVQTAAAIVAGMPGESPVNFERAALELNRLGHDVVIYSYGDLFADGDPYELPLLISEISGHFESQMADYKHRRFLGVSLGAGIAYNLQKRTEGDAEVALLAAGGTNAAENLFRNPIFKAFGIPRRFKQHGYEEEDVRDIWSEIQEPPKDPLVIAFGGLDYIVSYRKAYQQMRRWRSNGVPLRMITRPFATHEGIQRWFNYNIPTMLMYANELQ